jgi:hypothetical protein
MQVRSRKYTLLLLLLITLSDGCTSAKEYATLAGTGSTYAGAVAALADNASTARIESSSYMLLQQRDEFIVSHHRASQDSSLSSLLERANDKDHAYLELNQQTRDVAMHLQDYFNALQALAASSAPSDIGTKTGSIITQLNQAIKAADGSFVLPASSGSKVVSPALRHLSEAMLRHELTDRKTTILFALGILNKLTSTIRSSIDVDVSQSRALRDELFMEIPYTNPESGDLKSIGDKERWIALRQKHLQASSEDVNLNQLIAAADKSNANFRKLFDRMTSDSKGGVSVAELDSLVSDVNVLSGLLKTFR